MEILVVEDDAQVAAAVRRGLEAEGYTVDLAPDGLTGLRLAQRHAYRAIVLDIMLPGLNGYKVCEALRADGVTTPILMLTAKDGEYDEAEGLDTGADDYLTKPFSYLVFLARLRALIRRSQSPGPLLRVGDLWLDPAGRRCGRAGAEITLTEREFAVLRCLAEHPGEVLSKRRIVDEVWDIAFDGEESIVEVYVSMLRRKVDTPFGVRSITTVRGAGYRLEA
ncbi:response regulator transcription factor [Kitasatospora sp. NPDC091335]|uniref:response regulator transcription factor n=1 Tax=Streptomycetaceae TaxID=2062 RepID=UPI0016621939|nr:response regulator transcription factor [Streptomyces sp. CBMA156]MBD0670906.1 DNA-binding response regulator [Streptomyces sp. CBMA156]